MKDRGKHRKGVHGEMRKRGGWRDGGRREEH